MTFTLTWQTVLLPLLVIAAIVAVIYLCLVLAKLLGTLKKLDPILDDVKGVTAVASDLTEKADKTVNGMSDSVNAVVSNLKANKNLIKNTSAVIGAATSIIGVAKASGKKKEEKVEVKAKVKKEDKKSKKTKKDKKENQE